MSETNERNKEGTASVAGAAPHVVVIGAGILGSALSWELSSRGARVTVVDEEAPLAGATSKSFAWITNQAFFRAQDPVPDGDARAYFDLHRLGLGAWRRLNDRFGEDLGLRWHGTVQWAEDGPEAERLTEELRRRQQWGSPSYAITADELRQRLPDARIDDVEVAFYTPDEGTLNPFAAVPALLGAAVGAGAEVRRGCRVIGFDTENGKPVVIHEGGRIDCDEVIIACGRKTPELAGAVGIDVPLIESTGELVHLEPQEMFLDPLVLGSLVHAVQRADGRVVMGRHFTGLPVTDGDALNVEALIADAVALFPRLRGVKVEKVTEGRRILPTDALPIIGRSPQIPGIRAIASNAAVSLGPILAQLIATEVLDGVRVEVLDRYRADRFANTVA